MAGDQQPLVGRETDLARLVDFAAAVPDSDGSMLLVGEPGVGKTALLAAVTGAAEGRRIRVLSTVGVQYRAQVGYSAVQRLLTSQPEGRAAVTATPVLAVALGLSRGTTPGHEAVTDAVVALVAKLSAEAPTLLVLDDVQWLDRASADVLGQLARRLSAGSGLLCAARPGDEGFFDSTGLPVHELGPLSDAAAEELLTQRFPALAPRVRRRLMADAEGNPLALLELPAALTDSQRGSSQALPTRLPLTQRLESAFASRIDSLPAATRHLLLVAALEGSGNMQVLRRAVADRCSLKHLAPAERARLVHVDDVTGRLAFRHSLMRSAVVELSTSDQRRGVHRALAEAWAAVPEQRAWHLAQAAVDPDEPIAALLEEVADLGFRRGDGVNAVAALLRAADLTPSAAERARRLAKAAYVGAHLTGALHEVPRLLDTAHQVAPDADSLAAAVATATYLMNSHGDIDTAYRLLTGAIALLPEPYDATDVTLRVALSTLLIVCVHGARPEMWAGYDALLAASVDVPPSLEMLRATFADPARAKPSDWARLDAAIAELSGSPDLARIIRIATAGAFADRLGAMEEPLRLAARGGRTGENNFPAIQASFLWASHAFSTGQWSELREIVGNGLRLCEEFDYPLRSWTGKWVLGCVSALCGDYTLATAYADEMDRWAAPRRALAVRRYASHVRTLTALSQSEFEKAYQHTNSITPAGTFAPFAGHALWAVLDLVEAAVRTGRRAEALAHVAAAREAGLHTVSPRLAMVLTAGEAMAAEDDDEAVAGLRAASAVDGAERWPFDLARIQLHCGERLRRGRAMLQARDQLSAAAQTFDRLGAKPWTERANKELRAGGRAVHVAAGEDVSLTPQQWEIAGLAAAGLTNKQIASQLYLSPRTVSTHLYQLFPKLGVTSRAALRDALERFAGFDRP